MCIAPNVLTRFRFGYVAIATYRPFSVFDYSISTCTSLLVHVEEVVMSLQYDSSKVDLHHSRLLTNAFDGADALKRRVFTRIPNLILYRERIVVVVGRIADIDSGRHCVV